MYKEKTNHLFKAIKRSLKKLPVVCVLVLYACGNGTADKTQPVVKNVKVVYPVPTGMQTVRTFPGVVKVAQEINLSFKTAGQIAEVCVKEGDYVREGQTIARLDDKDYKLQLKASEANFNQMSLEMERMEELYRRGSLPVNDYEKFLAGFEQLKVQLETDRNTVSYTLLKAPVSGYIQSVNFRKSEMVNAGTSVMSLIDPSHVEIETELPAALYLRQNQFTGYTCKSTLLPDREFSLALSSVNHKSSGNQLHKMTFIPTSRDASVLMPGMSVEVNVMISNDNESAGFTLPVSAVFMSDEKSWVWIVNGQSEVQKREVRIGGLDSEGRIMVRSGITAGDNVVVAGVGALNESDNVRVIENPSATNVGGML